MRKGDKLLFAVQPKLTFASGEASSFGNNQSLNSGRKFIQNWVLVEVEIAKIKAASAAESKQPVAAAAEIDESTPTSNSSVLQRMAQLSGAGKLIGLSSDVRPSSQSPNSGEKPSFIPAARFDGVIHGYLFSTGNMGTGYYLDASASIQASSTLNLSGDSL
jgi:hypothetical protein